MSEIENNKLYRECKINFEDFVRDLDEIKKKEFKFSDLKSIFNDLKKLFNKLGYQINWKDLENQSFEQTINTLSMASPFSLEEKQMLLETITLEDRNIKLREILKTYTSDNFENTTIQ